MATQNNSKIDNFETITEYRHRKVIEAEGVNYGDLPLAVKAVIKDLSVTVEALNNLVDALSLENDAQKCMGSQTLIASTEFNPYETSIFETPRH